MVHSSCRETRHFRIGVVTTALTTPCRDVLEQYTSLYRHWRIDAPGDDVIHVRVEPRRRSPWRRKRYDVIVNETTRFEPARRAEVLPYVEWAINWEVPRVYPRFLQFHASSMQLGETRVIFPAASGSGKSTLTAGLLARGWRYLCDEFALVDTETLEVQPYPRAICIKKPSHAVVAGLGISLHERRHHLKGSKGYVGYVDPQSVGPRAGGENPIGTAGPVRAVIFPKYVAGAAPRLTPISRADAAFALHGTCFNLLGSRAVGLDVIAGMIRGAAGYRLVSGEINATCALIEEEIRRSMPHPARRRRHGVRREHVESGIADPRNTDPRGADPNRDREGAACDAAPRNRSIPCGASSLSGGPLESWLLDTPPLQRFVPASSEKWHRFARAAAEAGLAGVIRERARHSHIDLPEAARTILDHHADGVAARNLAMRHAMTPLIRALNRADVPVMLLKGAALLEREYDRPDLRPMSDVDFLVRPADANRATEALSPHAAPGMDLIREDFFPNYYYETELITRDRIGLRIDLHARPLRPLRVARMMPDDALWNDAVAVRIGDAIAHIPGVESMLVHLAAHAAYHGCDRLLWLYDIARLTRAHGGLIDWDSIVDRARSWGIALPVATALRETNRRLGDVCPPSAIRSLYAHRGNWKDRLTLAVAPREAASPILQVATNLLTVPGVRFRAAYLLALMRPSAAHLGESYPYRHPGWSICAQVCRGIRAIGRVSCMSFHTSCSMLRAIGRQERHRVRATTGPGARDA